MSDGWDLASEPPPMHRDFQEVEICGRPFAVPADAIRGRIAVGAATPVPGAPSHIRGVVMWKGQVVPVLASARRLLLARIGATPGPYRYLHLEVGGELFFLEVDDIGELIAGKRIEVTQDAAPMVAGFVEAPGVSPTPIPVLDLEAFTDFGHRGSDRDGPHGEER